jgi:hypothetical protein
LNSKEQAGVQHLCEKTTISLKGHIINNIKKKEKKEETITGILLFPWIALPNAHESRSK